MKLSPGSDNPASNILIETDLSAGERCEMLERTHWSDDFTWQEMETFSKYLRSAKVPGKTPVFREGEAEAYLGIIVEGKVHIVKEDIKQKQKILTVIGQGKTFGEMSLFDGEPRSATVIAAEDTTLLILNKEGLDRLIDEKPALGARILFKLGKLMSQRLRMTSGRLIDYLS